MLVPQGQESSDYKSVANTNYDLKKKKKKQFALFLVWFFETQLIYLSNKTFLVIKIVSIILRDQKACNMPMLLGHGWFQEHHLVANDKQFPFSSTAALNTTVR